MRRHPHQRSRIAGFAFELHRRRVPRAAGLYVLASWAALQVAATIFPLLDLPLVASKIVLAGAVTGFLPAMVVAWIYDLRFRSGFSRTRQLPSHTPSASAEVTRQISIVVLPFANMSPDRENEYFSDGVAEEITNALTKIEGLRVVSRTSAYSFRGKDISTREIGAQLDVAFVIEGSVRRADNRLRMAVKLARVSDDTVLWSEQYERVLNDVFAVQDEVTGRIVTTISEALHLGHLPGQVKVRPPKILQSYDLYLLGRHHWNRRTEAGMRKALELFEQALELDSDYAPAYSGISDASALLASWNFALPAEMYPRAVAAAHRGLELDESLAEAHASIGFIKYNWEWDWTGAVRELSRAIQLNPSMENAHRWLSGFLAGIGRDAEALPIAQRVIALDPLSVLPRMNLGIVHFLGGRQDEALAEFTTVVEMDPTFVRGHVFRAAALALLGRYQEAIHTAVFAVETSNAHPMMQVVHGYCLALAGRDVDARAVLEPLLPTLHGLYAAIAHLLLRNENSMYDALEKGVEERGDWLYSLGAQPWFKDCQTQPRFQDLLRRLNVAGDRALTPVPLRF